MIIVSVELSFVVFSGLGSKRSEKRTGLHGLPDCQSWSVFTFYNKNRITNAILFYITYYMQGEMEDSRKYPHLYHGRLLGLPKGMGGSRLWNSEGMGRGVFTIGNPKA